MREDVDATRCNQCYVCLPMITCVHLIRSFYTSQCIYYPSVGLSVELCWSVLSGFVGFFFVFLYLISQYYILFCWRILPQLLVDIVYNNLVVIVAIDSLLLDSLALFHHLSVHQLLWCFVSVKKCYPRRLVTVRCPSVCLSTASRSCCQQNSSTVELVDRTCDASRLFTTRPSTVMHYFGQGCTKHLVGRTHFTMPGPQSLC